MAPRRSLLFGLSATLLPACAFILDFDALQKGEATEDAGADGHAEDGAAAHDAATDVSEPDPCPTGCDDEDPCTEDTCTPGGCTHTVQPGVVPDGLDEVVTAETLHRVTMTARNDRFYLSALKTAGSSFELDLHHFDKTDASLSAPIHVSELDDFGAQPVSAAGLAAPDAAFEITAYVAFGTSPSLPAQVHRLTFDLDLEYQESLPAAADSNYSGGRRIHPIAWQPPGGDVYGAWPANGGGIFLHTGQNTQLPGEEPLFGKNQGQVFALAPLSAGSSPAVSWATADRVNVQAVGQLLPSVLGQCDQRPGTFLSLDTGYTTLEGYWFVGWTKQLSQNGVVSEAKPVECRKQGALVACGGKARCGADDTLETDIRNAQLDFLTRQDDPAGRVYEVLVQPKIDASASEATLVLEVVRVDIDPTMLDAGADVLPITSDPVQLAKTAFALSDDGPNWPALALLPPDRIGVAWLQPASDESGDELHVQRHRICFPDE